jgi:hypothetical protein
MFSFIFLTVTIFTIYPKEVKGATYNVSVGDAWTYSYTGGGTNAQTAMKVTSVSGTTCNGDIYEIGSDDEHTEQKDQNIASSYVKDLGMYGAGSEDFTATYTYAGRSISCRGYNNPSASIDVLLVDSVTGIVVEREYDNNKVLKIISWEYLTARAGAVPGYELPILLAISALSIIGVIFYIRKKQF